MRSPAKGGLIFIRNELLAYAGQRLVDQGRPERINMNFDRGLTVSTKIDYEASDGQKRVCRV